MKKIICPKCGEVAYYTVVQKLRQVLLFDAYDQPCGAGEQYGIYYGTVKHCPICDRVVKIVDKEDDMR